MTAQHKLTQSIADWIVDQQQAGLPTGVNRQVRRMMLDHVSGVVAAASSQTGSIVAKHAREQYAAGRSTVLGDAPLVATAAAMVNGTNAHGIETDDGYTPGSYHPSCVVFPAVFALAEETESSPERILLAAAIGAEVGCRIGAAGHPATRHRGFHNTAIVGVFSAAAASAVLLGLDKVQTANALGIAGSHASGLFEFLEESSEVKRFHAGKSARDGISAALLARDGLTGPTTVLEGKSGYFGAYAGVEGTDWHASTVRNGLGDTWVLQNTYVKPYPCCRHLHGAIDATLHLVNEHQLTTDDIAEIQVATFSIAAGHNNMNIDTIMGAQLSLPYALALAIARKQVIYTDFGPEHHADAELNAIMQRVSITTDPEADAAYPRDGRPATVTLRLTTGKEVSHHVQFPYGEPQNAISDASLNEKAVQAAGPVVGMEATQAMVDAIWNFAGLDFLKSLNTALRENLHGANRA